ncbi:MAG: hypothetical protein CL521_01965 [Actinobacteria bacterium]|mgnify:CR=1 FL=1|nr:hypothetical protein [Actinomycetota bacterium]|tara:strand:+ start:224 stop:826 length:603 start_codon:yes stop_codon:yes gene_type:complete
MMMRVAVLVLGALIAGSNLILAGFNPYSSDMKAEVARYVDAYHAAPTSNETQFQLAVAYAYTGEIRKGWSVLKQVSPSYATEVVTQNQRLLQQDPNEWRFAFRLAFGYYFMKQHDEALAQFERVLVIVPDHVWAMGFIGLIEGERGNVDLAIQWCHRALSIDHELAGIHFLLAEAYRRKGTYFKALKHLMISGRLEALGR